MAPEARTPRFAAPAGATRLSDFYEAQGHRFANGRRYSVPVHAIGLKIIEGNRQPTVVLAAVVG